MYTPRKLEYGLYSYSCFINERGLNLRVKVECATPIKEKSSNKK